MDLVLFGIQGSGKGTQARKIAERYNLQIFETGEQLRNLSKKNTPLGEKVKAIIESGQLVPNEVVMEIIENFMESLPDGTAILFDGIPRQTEQARTFQELMKKHDHTMTAVVIHISREEALKRLGTRRICSGCKTVFPVDYTGEKCNKCDGSLVKRSDDTPESITVRLDLYEKETMPVIKTFTEQGLTVTVNGEQSIDVVTQDLFAALDRFYKNQNT